MVDGKLTEGGPVEGRIDEMVEGKLKGSIEVEEISVDREKDGSVRNTHHQADSLQKIVTTFDTNLRSPQEQKINMKRKLMQNLLGRRYKQVDISSIEMSPVGEDTSFDGNLQ